MMMKRIFITSLLCAALTGCAKGPEGTPLELEIGGILREQLKLRFDRTPPPPRPVVTRAVLDDITEPYIEVTVEDVDLFDYLTIEVSRSDDLPGEIVVWRTIDNLSFAFRDGMLIATRGWPEMMLSATVPADGQGLQGPARGGARRFVFRGDDAGSYEVNMACELVDLGRERIEIVELFYDTLHLQERCEGDGGRIVNDYWVDGATGRVWQSRQWGGPELGYIRVRQVTI